MLGISEAVMLSGKQEKTVDDLRDALEIYYATHKSYPESLAELIGTKNDDDDEQVTQIPSDIITEQPYMYTRTETDYRLSYEILCDETKIKKDVGDTVPGTNTATKNFLSEEAAKLTDKDNDKLSAFDEQTYGTKDFVEDTDHDGYTDKQEVDAGYNPNGEGML